MEGEYISYQLNNIYHMEKYLFKSPDKIMGIKKEIKKI